MRIYGKKEGLFLFGGDVLILYLSLYLTLLVRSRTWPDGEELTLHLAPFSILFIVWILVYFIAGLYEKHTLILKGKLSSIILNAQVTNIFLSVGFFYFISYFSIAPKTNLFIFLVISSILIFFWRSYGHELFGVKRKQNAILIGTGEEVREIVTEVNQNPRYDLRFVSSLDINAIKDIDLQSEFIERVYSDDVGVVAIDLQNDEIEPLLPHLYNLIFSKVRFMDMHKIYEDIFDRIPLSLLRYTWFLENISLSPSPVYDFLKRFMDIVIALVLCVPSLIAYPLVWVAVKLEDGGPLFITQDRVGKNNQPIKIVKFRTMTGNDNGKYVDGATKLRETRTGAILRKTRIDELPQLWSVLTGRLSLIGPRPELPALVKTYEAEIPYYNVRHLIKPGLSGWAQIYHDNHPHHGEAVMQTKEKLSYDLYYIKNRSVLVDLKIALRTLQKLVSRSGI